MKEASGVDIKVEFDLIYFIIFSRLYAQAMSVTKEQHIRRVNEDQYGVKG